MSEERPSWQGYQFMAVEWSMVAICAILVAIRLRVQYVLRKGPWSEVFLILAWLLFLGSAVCDQLVVHKGSFQWDTWNWDANHRYFNFTPKDVLAATMRPRFAVAFLYKPSIYACKAVLLCFYRELAPKEVFKKIWIAIVISWVLIAMGTLSQILFNALACWPGELDWSYYSGGCSASQAYVTVTWSFHISTDLAVYILPFFIISKLTRLDWQQKLGAVAMFGVGFINIFMAIAILVLYSVPTTEIWQVGAVEFLLVLQQTTAILVVCLPQLRRFIKGTPDVGGGWREWLRDSSADTVREMPLPQRNRKSSVWRIPVEKLHIRIAARPSQDLERGKAKLILS